MARSQPWPPRARCRRSRPRDLSAEQRSELPPRESGRRGVRTVGPHARPPSTHPPAGSAWSPRCSSSAPPAKPQPGTPRPGPARAGPAAHLPLTVVPELQRAGRQRGGVSHTWRGLSRGPVSCRRAPRSAALTSGAPRGPGPLALSECGCPAGAGPVAEDISRHGMKTPNTCGLKTDFSKAALGPP